MMKRRLVYFLVVVAVALGLFFLTKNKFAGGGNVVKVEKLNQVDAKLYFQFVESKENWAAKTKDLLVTKEELLNERYYQVLQGKEAELLMALFYLQYVSYAEKPLEQVIIYARSDEGQLKSLLSQLAIPYVLETQVMFEKPESPELLASIGEKKILKSDIKKEHYLWGAFQTEVFHWKLATIDKIIKNKTLVSEAAKVGKNVQDYRQEYINQHLIQKTSKEELEDFRKSKGFENTKEGWLLTEKNFKESFERKGLDYFLEKYVLDLPIQVNLVKPNYKPELGMEYVPIHGPKNSEMQVNIFADTNSQSSHELLKDLHKIDKEFRGVSLQYRPILSGNNSFQDLREKINYCLWIESNESFWQFLPESQGFYNEKTQDKLFETAKRMGIDTSQWASCLQNNQTEKVIDYQKKYAAYLGIQSGPIVFIEGEVLVPPVSIEQVIKVINRQLGFADAAVW